MILVLVMCRYHYAILTVRMDDEELLDDSLQLYKIKKMTVIYLFKMESRKKASRNDSQYIKFINEYGK